MNMLQEVYSFLAALNVDLYENGYARNPDDVIKELCEEWTKLSVKEKVNVIKSIL